MVSVLAGDVLPVLAGDIYCSVLEGCQEIFDVRRAHEWTTSLSRWCASQPDLVRYRGECLIYRAEIMQWRGNWNEAEQDARAACELLTPGRGRAGAALYRLGEIHRLRGEFQDAEAAYTRANECGRKPQPGLSLLRLAQGDIDHAVASIRSALADTAAKSARARFLQLLSRYWLLPAMSKARAPQLQSSVRSPTPSARLFCPPYLRTLPAQSCWPKASSPPRRRRCGRHVKPGGISTRRTKKRKHVC